MTNEDEHLLNVRKGRTLDGLSTSKRRESMETMPNREIRSEFKK